MKTSNSNKNFAAINRINVGLLNTFNKAASFLNSISKKLGENGYLFFGFLSNTLVFVSMTSLKFIPNVDWSICFIIRGVAYYFFGIICSVIYQSEMQFQGKDLYYLNIRNLLMGVSSLFLQYAVVVLPITIVWITVNSMPLFIFLVNYYIFSVDISLKQIIFLFVSLLGVLLIMDPSMFKQIFEMFRKTIISDKENEKDEGQAITPFIQIISVLFLASQILAAFGISIIKKANNISSLTVTLHLGLVCIIFGSFALFQRSDFIQMPSTYDLFMVFLVYGLGTFFPCIIFIHGTMVAKCQGKYSLTSYVNVFYSFLFSMIYEQKQLSLYEIIGFFITFFGLYKLLVK
ncbi:integral membrane protein DUF6 containing protein (macronuclear) [Tetrahymena thermophila SB210]|uniref:Integral membrane protein DUF6 containing protein n=1 Tax=Tetrahymena thermophila (strain SB210) TaxID=312017 RepID=I7LU59_TETTS|nr:integral membrane protein DUF6 containing protein [Tetrahymena thermophila SB210]EAR89950.1 integral membrane protein DUF6 containing protein [Tetrahymena thermophila SB210]|eukprot:XP_001010195.1 integral membrane protein DUF6 containing protein [Tetrahymena thermophila SB210]